MSTKLRANVIAERNAGISPDAILYNASLLAMEAASAAISDAITAIADVEAAPDLATAQAAVGGGLDTTLGGARDGMDVFIV